MATNSIKLLTGNSHPQLAKMVADRWVYFSTPEFPRELKERKSNSMPRTYRLGIELAKTMSLNYSNQETSVTVGESVRDEDGTYFPAQSSLTPPASSKLTSAPHSIHPAIHGPRRHQRRPHGTPDHDQRMQDRICATHHSRDTEFPLRAPG